MTGVGRKMCLYLPDELHERMMVEGGEEVVWSALFQGAVICYLDERKRPTRKKRR